MIAGKKARFPVEPHSFEMAGGLVQVIWGIAKELKCPAFDGDSYGERVQDDHLALNQNGIPAIDIIDFKYPYWHRLTDLPENCSGESMEQVARVLSVWLQRIESAPSPPRRLIVGWTQIVFGAVLVMVLLFIALLYGVRQLVFLRRMRLPEEMPPGEWDHQHRQARRRVVMSALLLLLGIMLAGDLLFLEVPAQQLADQREAADRQGDAPPLSDADRNFARLYASFFILFLLVLMVVVLFAALDFWATRRYGIRQHRKLNADRRDMIEREIARLRQERNGHN